MNLRQTLEQAMHEAMRARDDLTRDTIRLLFASIKQVEVESRKTLDDNGIATIIQKEIKIRKETLTELQGSNRSDLLEKAQEELKILQNFLPAQMSDDEIQVLALSTISNINATHPSDMGRVMKDLLPRVQGKAAPDRVSQIVKKLLS